MSVFEDSGKKRTEAADFDHMVEEAMAADAIPATREDAGQPLRMARFAPSPLLFTDYGDKVRDFKEIWELLASGCNAFFIDTEDEEDALMAAESIRRNPPSAYAPVFSSAPHGRRFEALVDGVSVRIDEALGKSEPLLRALREVNKEAVAKNSDFRLLAWFYMRQGVELKPLAAPKTDDIYGYPVAECLAAVGVDHKQWLDGLRVRGQLAQKRLVDRVRVCPKCSSPHLNFIDVCPNCRSIDISKKELIHCFTCGRVGVADLFVRDNSMTCPFCRAALRHIGSDYDHPLESFVCEDCAESFTESQVLTVCHDCGARNAPDELDVRTYFTYALTEKGQVSTRIGEIENAYALFDRLGVMSYAYFEQMLDWNIGMLRRYKNDPPFTLIALRFVNIDEIGDVVGNARTAQMIDALTVRLKNIIRTTDMVMRPSMDTLCFFLPHTDGEQSRIVTGRMEALRDDVVLKDAPKLRLSINTRTLPESPKEVCGEGSAKMLLLGMTANI